MKSNEMTTFTLTSNYFLESCFFVLESMYFTVHYKAKTKARKSLAGKWKVEKVKISIE